MLIRDYAYFQDEGDGSADLSQDESLGNTIRGAVGQVRSPKPLIDKTKIGEKRKRSKNASKAVADLVSVIS